METVLHGGRGRLKSSEMSLDRRRSEPGEVVLGPTKRGLSSGLAVVLSFGYLAAAKRIQNCVEINISYVSRVCKLIGVHTGI